MSHMLIPRPTLKQHYHIGENKQHVNIIRVLVVLNVNFIDRTNQRAGKNKIKRVP